MLKGNWGSAILVCIVYFIFQYTLTSLITIPCSFLDLLTQSYYGNAIQTILLIPIGLFVQYPMVFALYMVFLQLVRDQQKPSVGNLFKVFKSPYYMKSVAVMFLMNLYIFFWSLLFCIPGIIKSLSYMMAPYIMIDNPEMKADDAIKLSMEMMKGKKGKLFLIILGYVGFVFLSYLACGIPLLFVIPYYMAVLPKFYEEVKSDYNMR